MNIVGVQTNFLNLYHSVTKPGDDELLVGVVTEVMLHWKLYRELCLRGIAGQEPRGRVMGLMLEEPSRPKI